MMDLQHDTLDGKALKLPEQKKIIDEPPESKAASRRRGLKGNRKKWMDPDNEALWAGEKE